MSKVAVRELIARLPESPGCYLFKDAAGEVIYVGKAKSLRHRVGSYFQESRPLDAKTEALLGAVEDLDFIATDSELEALVLENNLIKENKPRYNIVLKDDKNFPYLRLTLSEEYPRLTIVRRPRKRGKGKSSRDAYYGPYLPAAEARNMMRLCNQEFRLRSCREHLDGKRGRPCLYYQIGQCLAPCVASICSSDEYREAVNEAAMFLEGRDRELGERLKERMESAAGELRYEQAARYRDMLKTLGRHLEPQKASSTELDEQDVFGFFRSGKNVMAQVFVKRGGLIRRREQLPFEGGLGIPDGEIVAAILQQYYGRAGDVAREVLLPVAAEGEELLASWLSERRGGAVAVHVPQRGEKRRFVEMAMENARLAVLTKASSVATPALEELEVVLGLPSLPRRIEGFDNSNIQGTDPVSSLVVFEEGLPKKSEYRKFGIKSVVGADDFATMKEVVGRRYRRVVEEGLPLPDLVLIDGGKGQVSAACEALAELSLRLPVVGLAKREELLVLPDRDEPVGLPRDSEGLKLLQRVRDEAHRFAITFHRQRRSKSRLTTELSKVPGLGPVRARRLLRAFPSSDAVVAAPEEDVAKVVGPMLARRIREVLGATAR